MSITDTDNRVIVSGCGPVGAVMTLALVKKGIPVTLIEQLPDAAEDQRAATIHPPTVEMLVDLGLEKETRPDHQPVPVEAPRPMADEEIAAASEADLDAALDAFATLLADPADGP